MPLQGKKNEPLHSTLRTESHHMNKHTYKETREESLPAYLKANYLQPDGTALIEIDLSSTDIFNPLSYGKGRTLNQDIFDLIDDESNLIPATIPLHIRFHAASLTSDQKDEIENLYREHYQALVYDQEWDHRQNRFRFWRLTIVGAVLMALYIYFSVSAEDSIGLEVLSTLASVALWLAAEILLVTNRDVRIAIHNLHQLRDASIEFEEDN